MTDETHSVARRSWVASANGHADFPIQNLPFGVFTPGSGAARAGVAIGDETFEWSRHDVFTVPHWTFARHEARGGGADLFMVTDKSAFERLDLVREEME